MKKRYSEQQIVYALKQIRITLGSIFPLPSVPPKLITCSSFALGRLIRRHFAANSLDRC